MIKLRYSSIDGARKTRSFKSFASARRFAVGMVGAHPEFGCGYAVSGDGIGKIEIVEGATLAALFGVTVDADADARLAPAASAAAAPKGAVKVLGALTRNIAYPGHDPIWATEVDGSDGKIYVFTDARVLTTDRAEANKFRNKVVAKGFINPDLWDQDRPTYTAEAADQLWQWEQEEQAAGRW